MYTAKLLNKQEISDGLQVVIEYTNGDDLFQETMTTNGSFRTVKQLKEIVKSKIERLNSLESITSELIVGEQIQEPTPEAEKTQDEQDLELFVSNYEKLKKVNTLITQGVLVGDEAAVLSLLSTVKASFRAEYIDLI